MKRIRLKTMLAGPTGNKHPGEHVVTDEEAAALCAAGCAEILGEAAEAPVVEKTIEEEEVEETVEDKPRPRKNPPTRRRRR